MVGLFVMLWLSDFHPSELRQHEGLRVVNLVERFGRNPLDDTTVCSQHFSIRLLWAFPRSDRPYQRVRMKIPEMLTSSPANFTLPFVLPFVGCSSTICLSSAFLDIDRSQLWLSCMAAENVNSHILSRHWRSLNKKSAVNRIQAVLCYFSRTSESFQSNFGFEIHELNPSLCDCTCVVKSEITSTAGGDGNVNDFDAGSRLCEHSVLYSSTAEVVTAAVLLIDYDKFDLRHALFSQPAIYVKSFLRPMAHREIMV